MVSNSEYKSYPSITVIGTFSSESLAQQNTSSFLTALSNANWNIYNPTQSNNEIVWQVVDSTNQVGLEITYYYVSELSNYALDVQIVANAASQQTSAQMTTPTVQTSTVQLDWLYQYPSAQVTAYLTSLGIYNVTIPSFSADKYLVTDTTYYSYRSITVTGTFSSEQAAQQSAGNYISALYNASWSIGNPSQDGSEYVWQASDPSSKVGIEIRYYYVSELSCYALDTQIIGVQGSATSAAAPTTQAQTERPLLFSYPSEQIRNYLGNKTQPLSFSAPGYLFKTVTIENTVEAAVLGIYSTKADLDRAYNNLVSAYQNTSGWMYGEAEGIAYAYSSDYVGVSFIGIDGSTFVSTYSSMFPEVLSTDFILIVSIQKDVSAYV